jgi:hypothetical protein
MKVRISLLMMLLALGTTGAFAHGGAEHVMGTVTKITDTTITVKTAAKEVNVTIAPATKFIKSKAAAKVTDLAVGERVVIHAVPGADDKLTAETVEFGAAAKTAQSAPAKSPTPKAPAMPKQ